MSSARAPAAMTGRLAPYHKLWSALIAYALRERAGGLKLAFPNPTSGLTPRLHVALKGEWIEHVAPEAHMAEDCCRTILARCSNSAWKYWVTRFLRSVTARFGVSTVTVVRARMWIEAGPCLVVVMQSDCLDYIVILLPETLRRCERSGPTGQAFSWWRG